MSIVWRKTIQTGAGYEDAAKMSNNSATSPQYIYIYPPPDQIVFRDNSTFINGIPMIPIPYYSQKMQTIGKSVFHKKYFSSDLNLEKKHININRTLDRNHIKARFQRGNTVNIVLLYKRSFKSVFISFLDQVPLSKTDFWS